jgi:hypothetical protein
MSKELILGQFDELEGLQEIGVRNDDGTFCPKLYAPCYGKDDVHYEDDQAFVRQVVRICNAHDDLLAACKTAIRIKKLWRPDGVYGIETKAEGKAVEAMYQQLVAAAAKAKKGQ